MSLTTTNNNNLTPDYDLIRFLVKIRKKTAAFRLREGSEHLLSYSVNQIVQIADRTLLKYLDNTVDQKRE